MEKKNGLIVLIIILSILVIGLSGFIIYDKVLSNNKKETEISNKQENNINYVKEEKKKISTEELQNLEIYINKVENNAFILMDYSNPEYILAKNNIEILKYSINGSDFSKNATDNQSNIIWNGNEQQVSTRVSTIEDLSSYIKAKTNYEISKEKISNGFNSYFNEELNVYYYLISDSVYEEHKIINGYKINNEYHIILDNNSEVVLLFNNDKYYFYSCNNNNN